MQFHFLTKEQTQQLIENGRANAVREDREDFKPVVRLYSPWGQAIWLLTEIDPDDYTIAFGLSDLGTGLPVLGPVDLTELASMSGPEGQQIARDDSFIPTRKLSTYAIFARIAPRVSK